MNRLRRQAIIALVLVTVLWAARRQPSPEVLGIRLGMSYAQAHSKLSKLGQLKQEEEGQEVWSLRDDRRYQFLMVGYDHERKVRYVTALARPGGIPVRYEEIGDLASAVRSGHAGNLRFTWSGEDKQRHFKYLAIAKGAKPDRLSSYSVKRTDARVKEEED